MQLICHMLSQTFCSVGPSQTKNAVNNRSRHHELHESAKYRLLVDGRLVCLDGRLFNLPHDEQSASVSDGEFEKDHFARGRERRAKMPKNLRSGLDGKDNPPREMHEIGVVSFSEGRPLATPNDRFVLRSEI